MGSLEVAEERPLARDPYREYLESPAWQERRQAALRRAGHRCQVCNGVNRLNVHHRTYERVFNEDPGDLTVLCRGCHEMFHGIGGSKPRRLAKPRVRDDEVRARLTKVVADLRPGVRYSTKHLANLVGVNVSRLDAAARDLARDGVLWQPAKRKWQRADRASSSDSPA